MATTTSDPFGPIHLPPLPQRNMVAVLQQALARHPHKPAVRDPERCLSYQALVDEALALAGGFAAGGVAAGEAVLLMLDNHVDSVSCWLALALTGRVEVPVNTAYKGNILAHVLANSGARCIVIEAHHLPLLAAVLDKLPALEWVVVRESTHTGLRSTPLPPPLPRSLRQTRLRDLPAAPAAMADLQPWDLIGILYTSGTTGVSKGVRITHAHAYGYASPLLSGPVRPDEVNLVTLPLFHIGGQWAGVYRAWIAGGSAVVLPRFGASSFWQEVHQHGATTTLLLGAMANFLWRQPPSPLDRGHNLSQLIMVPVMAELADFQQRFGIAEVGSGYGLTEGSTITRAPMGHAGPGHCGWLRPDFEARLVDEHDIEVADGEVGELLVRSREPWSLMDGYHAMPEATVKAWRNQWLHTGDAFRRDAQGRYWFLDRLKDAMRRRGENVSSFEVETGINEHPAVLESAVIAVPADDSEDEIKACVVLRPGQALDGPALRDFLESRLPYFMVPRYVEFLEQLPKTPTEKVQKQKLRERGLTQQTWDGGPARRQR